MDILCISGKIKVWEKTFLSVDDISRIVNAKTFGEVIAMLNGTLYQISHPITSPSEIYNFFEDIILNLIKEIEKFLTEELYRYFLLPYDFHNLKLVLDRYRTGRESKNYIPYSSVDYFTLKEALEKNNFKEIPQYLKPLLEFAYNNRDNENVMLLAKKIYWKIAKGLLNTQNSDFIDKYLKIEIDLSNIGIFLQQKIAGLSLEIKLLSDGGNIKKERYEKEETLWTSVGMIYPGVKTPFGVEEYDMLRYNLLMDYLKYARVVPSGIEPIFSYFAARQIEIDNLRRILLGKFYNVDISKIETWVLPVYQYG